MNVKGPAVKVVSIDERDGASQSNYFGIALVTTVIMFLRFWLSI